MLRPTIGRVYVVVIALHNVVAERRMEMLIHRPTITAKWGNSDLIRHLLDGELNNDVLQL